MTITVQLKDASRYIDEIAQSQLPYGCAIALTNVSKAIGDHLAKTSAQRFHTLTPYSRTHKVARLGGQPSPGSSYATLPANKADGISGMKATLGQQHWGMAEQIDDDSTIRKPVKSKRLWIPLQGRRRKYGPGKARKESGTFVIKTSRGDYMMMKRKGKKLTPLFLSRKQQKIIPKFSMKATMLRRTQHYMDYFFPRAMENAIRTARWP